MIRAAMAFTFWVGAAGAVGATVVGCASSGQPSAPPTEPMGSQVRTSTEASLMASPPSANSTDPNATDPKSSDATSSDAKSSDPNSTNANVARSVSSTVASERPAWTPPGAPPRPNARILPDAADEGPRLREQVEAALKSFVESQKYGSKWHKTLPKDPPVQDRRGLGGANSAAGLEQDPMEMQSQVQFVEDTDANLRFGTVSVRGQRIYRHGKLRAVRVLLERIGSAKPEAFQTDVEVLSEAWKEPVKAFALGDGFRVVRNDLADRPKRKTKDRNKPLRVDFEPVPRGK